MGIRTLLGDEVEEGLIRSDDPAADLEAFFRHRAAFVGSEGSEGHLIFSDGLVHLAGDAGRERIAQWRKRTLDYLLERLGALQLKGKTSSPWQKSRALSLALVGPFGSAKTCSTPGTAAFCRRQKGQRLRRKSPRDFRHGLPRPDLALPSTSMLVQGVLLTFAMQATLRDAGTLDPLELRIDHAWLTLRAVLFV